MTVWKSSANHRNTVASLETLGLVEPISESPSSRTTVSPDPAQMTRQELEAFFRGNHHPNNDLATVKREKGGGLPQLKRKMEDIVEAEEDGDVTFIESRPAKGIRMFIEEVL